MSVMNYEQALRCTLESVWSNLLVNEKRDALQAIEYHIAQFEGRKGRTILIENMDEGYYGYYNHGDSEHIHLSPFALRTSEEAIKTTLHEGRHAYQHDCLDTNTGFPQPTLAQFREGFETYISPEENFLAYANNFTEKDAESFAEQQCKLLDIDREAVLHREAKTTESITAEHSSDRFSTMRYVETEHARGYDWENQTTYPELGREVAKVRGRGETETLVTDLREIPMSTEDFHQYYDYFMSDEVKQRPPVIRERMASHLKGMAFSLSSEDQVGYYDSRSEFLDLDALYQSVGYEHGKKEKSTDYIYNARKASVSAEEYDLQAERNKAVSGAWAKEIERVRNGRGTWDWSVEQQAELLDTGRVSGFEGSHMLSAKDYPEHAGNPDNIQLIPSIAHFDGVHERNPRGNTPNGVYNPNTGEIMPIEDGKIPSLPEFELTDQYDPSQKEFHDTHPEFEQSGVSRRQGYKETKERHPEKSLNMHNDSHEVTDQNFSEQADKQHVMDMSPDENYRGSNLTEEEMAMNPSESVQRQRAAEANVNMNMEPSAEIEQSRNAYSEPNMAPRSYEAPSMSESENQEMNMAPEHSEGREKTSDIDKKQMNDHGPALSAEPVEGTAHSEIAQNNIPVSETPSQEQGLSW